MYGVELYAAVRLAVVEEGLSHHEAGRRFGIDRRTVKKMLRYSAPPGYRRTKPVRRPKLDGFTGIIDAILEADAAPEVPRKQRHTAHRIFERLRDEHGFRGGYTIVKDYVQDAVVRRRARPSFRCITRPAMPMSTSARRQSRSGHSREGRYLLPDPAALRRVVREGLSEGDDGGLPSTDTSAPSPSSAGSRARSTMTTRRCGSEPEPPDRPMQAERYSACTRTWRASSRSRSQL